MKFRFSTHAQNKMAQRKLPQNMVAEVLENPQQIVPGDSGEKVYQSKVAFPDGNVYLLRVIVNNRIVPTLVITVYRTSKIEKYWRYE